MSEDTRKEGLPDVSADQRMVAELIKQIRKLRWAGREREAEELRTRSAPEHRAEK